MSAPPAATRPDNVTPIPPVEMTALPTTAELDEIEDNLLAGLELDEIAKSEIVRAEAPSDARGRKPRKEKLIDDIQRFRDVPGALDHIPVNWKLKKLKLADLEIVLAKCVSAASGHGLRPNTAATAATAAEDAEPPQTFQYRAAASAPRPDGAPVRVSLDAPGLNGRNIAKTLCDMNVLGMEMLEFGTQCAAPYTGGIIVAGAAAELRSREEELEDIIRRVYADNKEVLDKYVSPTMAWASMMAAVSLKNLKKIDEKTGEVQTPGVTREAQARAAASSRMQSAPSSSTQPSR